MSWLTNFVRPKISALMGHTKTEIPENLWNKCTKCEQMIFQKDFERALYVCHHCGYHSRVDAKTRLQLLFDDGVYHPIATPKVVEDPIRFKDSKKYSERIKEYRTKTGDQDVLLIAEGKVKGHAIVVAAFNFSFMGGSMGLAVGQAFVAAAEHAIARRIPFLAIPASGGARMQEGILSLMQMPRTTVAVQRVREAGLPYWTLLTDPTTGGVAASFAMLGDIAIAEPGAVIGFAGARVVEETIREKLPEGFQRSEYLLDHGMVDMVVARKDLPDILGKLTDLVMHTQKIS